jgi:hypothetical protein
MVKSSSYHRLLCEFIENDCIRERCDYAWESVPLTNVVNVLVRPAAYNRWDVYVVYTDPAHPDQYRYRTLYYNMEKEIAHILCGYAKRLHGIDQREAEETPLFQEN